MKLIYLQWICVRAKIKQTYINIHFLPSFFCLFQFSITYTYSPILTGPTSVMIDNLYDIAKHPTWKFFIFVLHDFAFFSKVFPLVALYEKDRSEQRRAITELKNPLIILHIIIMLNALADPKEGVIGNTYPPSRFEFPKIEKKWYETKQNEKKR